MHHSSTKFLFSFLCSINEFFNFAVPYQQYLWGFFFQFMKLSFFHFLTDETHVFFQSLIDKTHDFSVLDQQNLRLFLIINWWNRRFSCSQSTKFAIFPCMNKSSNFSVPNLRNLWVFSKPDRQNWRFFQIDRQNAMPD